VNARNNGKKKRSISNETSRVQVDGVCTSDRGRLPPYYSDSLEYLISAPPTGGWGLGG